MTAQQLKNSILKLAISGKLVPQDPNDEPASVLIEKIRKEKEKLVKEGKIKKEKNPSYIFRASDNMPYEKVGDNEPVCIADEVPFEIPESWEWVRFNNIANYNMGKTPPRKESKYWENAKYNWISIADMVPNGKILKTKEKINDYSVDKIFKKQISKIGTLIMSFKLTVGRVSILDIDAYHNEAIISIYPYIDTNNIMTKYLFLLLPFITSITDTKAAIKGNTLNSSSLNNLMIPLAPLNEQKRIVNEFEKYLSLIDKYDSLETELNKLNAEFPEKLKKSILQQAIQGKLVEQNSSDEPASVLLEKIRREKEKLIKEGKIKKDKNESIIYKRDNSYYEKLNGVEKCIDDEIPFELPENWSFIRLKDFGIYKKGPFGSSLTKSIFVKKNENTVKVYEQKNAIYKDHNLGEYYITRDYYESKMVGFTVQPGDIIVSCAGTIGESYILPSKIEFGIINQALMKITLLGYIDKEYYILYFDYLLKKVARNESKGSAIKNIPPFDILKHLLFALPPINEQKRIINRIVKIKNLYSKLKELL